MKIHCSYAVYKTIELEIDDKISGLNRLEKENQLLDSVYKAIFNLEKKDSIDYEIMDIDKICQDDNLLFKN